MPDKKYNTIKLISVLALLAVISTLLMAAFTFAGNSESPNVTASYTRNSITWDTEVDSNGVANLNFFGEPEEGKDMPLVHPFSKDKFVMRIKNIENGAIGYRLYLYTENPHKIPLKLDVEYDSGMLDTEIIPTDLQADNIKILAALTGQVGGKNLKDINVDWRWVTETDEIDTAIGNKAVGEDLIFDINARIIIEDNNSYGSGGGGSGGSRKPSDKGDSDTWMLHRNYVIGYPEGDFRQNNNISRAEVATIFARIIHDYDESLMTKTSTSFNDTPFEWYIKYIAEIEELGVMTGYGDGTFKPDAPITRAEFATACVRYFEREVSKIKTKKPNYTDLDKKHWAFDYIGKCLAQGIMQGYPDGSFKPDVPITRAEAVTTVNRLLGRSADREFVDTRNDEMIQFSDLQDNTYWAYYEIYEAANSHYARFNADNSETWLQSIDNKILNKYMN